MTTEEIIEKAIKKYGSINQCIVAIEEMSELQKEITKALRGEDSRQNIIEEIADVEIMIKQLCRIFHISVKEVYTQRKAKLKRLEKRIG